MQRNPDLTLNYPVLYLCDWNIYVWTVSYGYMNMKLATFSWRAWFPQKVFCIFIIVFKLDLSGWYILSNLKRYTTSICISIQPTWWGKPIHKELTL